MRSTPGIRDVLERVRKGELSLDEAEKMLKLLAVKDLGEAMLDISRETRRNVPEVVFGEGKDPDQLYRIIIGFLSETGRAIVSRISRNIADLLIAKLKSLENCNVRYKEQAKILIAKRKDFRHIKLKGKVGIVTAGTADLHVAEEIRAILEELGCKVLLIADAGTAGLQRVVKAAHKLIEEDVDVAVILAGMEGALPSALASIVDIPIIGVPTSIGYGFGARGAAALMNMLQSCSLGLTVVNIDNGVAAAIAAYLILRRIKRK